MYYFRHCDENYLSIDINGKIFEAELEQKIHIEFSQKEILCISIYDENGNLLPIKKSSELRKKIFNAIQNEDWEKFTIENEPIEGLSNEDGELVSPLVVLYPAKNEKKQKNSFAQYMSLITSYNLPTFNDQDVIKKQKLNDDLHIYYRKNDNIYHICINEFEHTISSYESFLKV